MEAIKNMSNCEFCGDLAIKRDRHHLIPYELTQDDGDNNVMTVCTACHRRLDTKIKHFLLYGALENKCKEHADRLYKERFMARRQLDSFTAIPYIRINTQMAYNKRTDHFGFWNNWRDHQKYRKPKKKHIPWNKGIRMSEEVNEKNRKAHLGQVPWNKGVPHSEETKRKISEATKGRMGRTPWNKGKRGIYSEGSLQKMREAHLGRTTWNKGKNWSEETKRKMSETLKRRAGGTRRLYDYEKYLR